VLLMSYQDATKDKEIILKKKECFFLPVLINEQKMH
jgi:hypothetical protein